MKLFIYCMNYMRWHLSDFRQVSASVDVLVTQPAVHSVQIILYFSNVYSDKDSFKVYFGSTFCNKDKINCFLSRKKKEKRKRCLY